MIRMSIVFYALGIAKNINDFHFNAAAKTQRPNYPPTR